VSARVAVIGLGRMGSRHAAALRAADDLVLAAAVDPAGDRHHAAPGVPVLASIDQLRQHDIDYAVLASPTTSHMPIGAALADAGIPTLIEKPLAGDLHTATQLHRAFHHAGVPAAVGYIERHQPTITVLHHLLHAGLLGDLIAITSTRAGAYPARITDVGVTHDLATHDIDLAGWLCGQPYTSITARVRHHGGRPHEDLLTTIGQLADGTLVSHHVSWLAPVPARQLTVTTAQGILVADTRQSTLVWHHGGHPPAILPHPASTNDGTTTFALSAADPLTAEHRAFCDLLRGRPSAIADLDAGLRAVAVAEAAALSARTGTTQPLSNPFTAMTPEVGALDCRGTSMLAASPA
jgi:UDP-N-acetylglucosamine 3-dehydrogenase